MIDAGGWRSVKEVNGDLLQFLGNRMLDVYLVYPLGAWGEGVEVLDNVWGGRERAPLGSRPLYQSAPLRAAARPTSPASGARTRRVDD
jgi:hypothetical protein